VTTRVDLPQVRSVVKSRGMDGFVRLEFPYKMVKKIMSMRRIVFALSSCIQQFGAAGDRMHSTVALYSFRPGAR